MDRRPVPADDRGPTGADSSGAPAHDTHPRAPARSGLGWFGLGAVAVALLLAFAVSPFASSKPDGLEKVAADEGLDREVRDHVFADGPLADYAVSGIDDERLSTGVAGVIGVTVTLAVGVGMFGLLRLARRRRASDTPAGPAAATPA